MIRFVSVNIERSKHLDLVLPFLQKQNTDVVCIQELMERDIPRFEEVLGPCLFAPATKHTADGLPGIMGTGVCSRLPVRHRENIYYLRGPDDIPDFDFSNAKAKHATEGRAVSIVDIEKDGVIFRSSTTHFTWTPNGEADDLQRADMRNLLPILESMGEFILAGDFNAPRGGEIFSELSGRYTDNIPARYATSIDVNLHRAGHLPEEHMDKKMVDGLFTTPKYVASNVELVFGVSDHAAIVADISAS